MRNVAAVAAIAILTIIGCVDAPVAVAPEVKVESGGIDMAVAPMFSQASSKPSESDLTAARTAVDAATSITPVGKRDAIKDALTSTNYGAGMSLPQFGPNFDKAGRDDFNNPQGSRQRRYVGCKYALYSWWNADTDSNKQGTQRDTTRETRTEDWCGLIADLTVWHWAGAPATTPPDPEAAAKAACYARGPEYVWSSRQCHLCRFKVETDADGNRVCTNDAGNTEDTTKIGTVVGWQIFHLYSDDDWAYFDVDRVNNAVGNKAHTDCVDHKAPFEFTVGGTALDTNGRPRGYDLSRCGGQIRPVTGGWQMTGDGIRVPIDQTLKVGYVDIGFVNSDHRFTWINGPDQGKLVPGPLTYGCTGYTLDQSIVAKVQEQIDRHRRVSDGGTGNKAARDRAESVMKGLKGQSGGYTAAEIKAVYSRYGIWNGTMYGGPARAWYDEVKRREGACP